MSMLSFFAIGLLLAFKLIVQSTLIMRQRSVLKKNRHAVPANFLSHLSLSEHQKAADYGEAKLRFALWHLWFKAAILSFWIFSGALGILDSRLFLWISHPIWQPLALLMVVGFISSLLELPWSWWSTFRLEQKFGFNRSTLSIFVSDIIKGGILSTVIALILGYPLVLLMHKLPGIWWVPAFLAYVAFQFLIVIIWPVLIAPLFNKFTPLDNPSLKSAIAALLKSAGYADQGVFVMDASRRSGHGNAYFTGLGKAKRIVFFDTLLEKLTESQIIAVLAHEVGHLARNHIKKGMVLGVFTAGIGFWLLAQFSSWNGFFIDLGLTPTHGVVLVLAMWLGNLLTFPLGPFFHYLSRRHEFEADQYASQFSTAKDLGDALLALHRDNASSVVVDSWFALWTYGHPPLSERLKALGY